MADGKREKSKYPGVYWRVSSETGEKSYYIRYRLGGRGSKEIEEPVGKSSAGMTEARAAQVRSSRMAGKSDPNTVKRAKKEAEKRELENRWDVNTMWSKYDAANESRSCRAADAANYRNHLAPLLGEKQIAELGELDFQRVLSALEKKIGKRTGKPLSNQTKRHVLALLKRMLRYAAAEKVPCVSFEPPKGMPKKADVVQEQHIKTEVEYMSDGQMAAYARALTEEPDQDKAAFFKTMLLTGIRRNALLHLRWQDVNFQKQTLLLTGEFAKNGKDSTVPVTEQVLGILSAITRTDSEFIWPGIDGGARTDFRRMGKRLRDKAGLPKNFRPCHGLRHTFASHLVSSGVDLYQVQTLLTHSSVEMTQRYAKLKDEVLREAASKAGSMLSPSADATDDKVVNIGKK